MLFSFPYKPAITTKHRIPQINHNSVQFSNHMGFCRKPCRGATIAGLLLMFLFLREPHGQTHRCGLPLLAEQRRLQLNNIARRQVAREGSCSADILIGPLRTRQSDNFMVYYTLEGPHAVLGSNHHVQAQEFLDTLLVALEKSLILHRDSLGMRTPLPALRTPHYRQTQHNNLYPVEVLDLGLLRNTWADLGGPCEGCYGLTWPDFLNNNENRSTLLIENDFRFQLASDELRTWNGICTYTLSERPLQIHIQGRLVDYSIRWDLALQATAVHELYHAVQLRYSSLANYHFWWEAGATGVEELGAPHVNDYLQYLDPLFNAPGVSLHEISAGREYGQGVFYQFLNKRTTPNFDHAIWTRIAQVPQQHILWTMQQAISTHSGLALDSLFHQHIIYLFLAGTRHLHSPLQHWSADAQTWPNMAVFDDLPSALPPLSSRIVSLSPAMLSQPLSMSQMHVTLVSLPAQGPAILQSLTNGETIRSISPAQEHFLVITSGIIGGDLPPPPVEPRTVKAWPQPWRGSGHLCFSAGGSSFPGAEILDGGLSTILRIPPSTQNPQCLSPENIPLSPGVYRYRLLDEKTLHLLLIIS